jgi:polyisoprenoid-binding protein YceI
LRAQPTNGLANRPGGNVHERTHQDPWLRRRHLGLDAAHSDTTYSLKHLGIAKSRGSFTAFNGQIVTAENILDSTVTIEIDADSVASGIGQRDDHIKSEEFFHVAEHPTVFFKSTGI